MYDAQIKLNNFLKPAGTSYWEIHNISDRKKKSTHNEVNDFAIQATAGGFCLCLPR